MNIIIILVGIFVMLLGFGYLCAPKKVTAFNAWVRENLFNDRLLIMQRRKTGVLLIFIGLILIYIVMR